MGPATGHVAVQKGGRPVVALAEVASSVFLFITPPAGVTPRLTRYGSPSSRNSRIRLLRPEDFLTVGQSDPHPPGDRIQVFPGEREDVGQEGFDALVLRFGKPLRRAWPPRDAASSPRRAASAFTVRPPAYRNAFAALGDRPK